MEVVELDIIITVINNDNTMTVVGTGAAAVNAINNSTRFFHDPMRTLCFALFHQPFIMIFVIIVSMILP